MIHLNEQISLRDVYSGQYAVKEIIRQSMCNLCDGTGFNDKIVRVCKKCRGKKTLICKDANTKLSKIIPCEYCHCIGIDISNHKCEKCMGKRVIDEIYKLTYLIPIGVENGETIIIKNSGNIMIGNNVREHVSITINISYDHLFKTKYTIGDKLNFLMSNGINMNNNDLFMEMNVPLVNAMCGIDKNIKLPNDEVLRLKNDRIDFANLLHVEKNVGLPTKNNKNKCGMLFIKFNIIFPMIESQNLLKRLYDVLKDDDFNDVERDNTTN